MPVAGGPTPSKSKKDSRVPLPALLLPQMKWLNYFLVKIPPSNDMTILITTYHFLITYDVPGTAPRALYLRLITDITSNIPIYHAVNLIPLSSRKSGPPPHLQSASPPDPTLSRNLWCSLVREGLPGSPVCLHFLMLKHSQRNFTPN